MHLKYLKQPAVVELRRAIGTNLQKYSVPTPWLGEFFGNHTYLGESKLEVQFLPKLVPPGPAGELYEIENAVALHHALRELTPSQAADERLWVWLAHDHYWDYMRARWPVDSAKNPCPYITEHYFLTDARSLVRHGLARLWWFGYASYQPGNSDSYRLTKLLLKTTDARQSIMERQFWRNREVLAAMLERIGYWEDHGLDFYSPRERFRRLCKSFNLFGGTMLLDALNATEVQELIDEVAQFENAVGEPS